MAADANDLLKKLSRRWVGQIGPGGVADAVVMAIPLASATNLPTDTAVVAVIDRVDANGTATASLEETVIGVVSGSNLVSCIRGAEGTAQAHDAGAVVEILFTAKGWNDLVDALLVQHDQAGRHTDITACNVSASGVVTTNVISEKTSASGVTIDGLLIKDGAISGLSTDGWTDADETWTYASATTFTVAGVDVTAKYPKGTKLKLTQTTAKYFYVVGSAFSTNTTITVTGGDDYTLANAAITSPFYSYAATPQGFPTWFNWTPSYGAGGSMTYASVTTSKARFFIVGDAVTVEMKARGTTGGTASASITFTLPIAPATADMVFSAPSVSDGAGASIAGYSYFGSGTTVSIGKYDNSNWGLGTLRDISFHETYKF